MTKSPLSIQPYGTAPIFRRIAKALAKRQRQGFVPAGWNASRVWKQQNQWMFS